MILISAFDLNLKFRRLVSINHHFDLKKTLSAVYNTSASRRCKDYLQVCSGSLEPESSCHDRNRIMELPMEADILTFTGILTPEDASVASCLLRLRRKLLRSSTRMRLPILISVRAWARLFHVSASGA